MLQLNRLVPNFIKIVPAATQLCGVESRRHYPARGTKPKTRWFFDFKHLDEITEGKYTHRPLQINRLGGRNPETGHRETLHIGGGVKFDYFMVSLHRRGPETKDETYDERVIEIRRDPNRTPHIALVAGEKGKRWIYATQNMKAGQIIKSSCYIPRQPITGIEGNAYPIGALLEGTLVNTVELYPSEDSHVCITEAGCSGEIVRHQGRHTIVRMANKHEYALLKKCMATVGKLSHEDYRDKIYGSAQMHRRFGYRMRGTEHKKKDGYHGRKVRPLPKVRKIGALAPKLPNQKFTLSKQQLSAFYGTAAVPKLVAEFNNVVRF